MNSINNKKKLIKKLRDKLSLKTTEDRLQFETEKLNLDIIHVISTIMEKNNWSKADLAKKLNTSKSFITQLFNGDKLINLKTLAKIQQESGLKFRFELEEQILPEKEEHILKNVYNISEVLKDEVADYIKSIMEPVYEYIEKSKLPEWTTNEEIYQEMETV
jgi:transcriptional regulator with XRE-family HTH domain